MSGLEIYVQDRPWMDGCEVYIRAVPSRQTVEVTSQALNENLEWEDVSWGEVFPHAPIMSYESAQRLANSLWAAGIRPSSTKESSTALEATKYHLEDMRKLVFDARPFITMEKV